MLCVIPVSSHDAKLIPAFTKALRHFGPHPLHQALVVVRPSDEEHGKEIYSKLEGLFGGVTLLTLPQDGPSGWPRGCNHYWAATISYLMSTRNDQPWLWCELDCTPLKEGWLDQIATEYNLVANSKPFMGVIEKTHATNPDGEPVDAGRHLVGVAVYPPNIAQISQLWAYVPQMPTPFDVVTQWEVVPKAHETELMQHCFRTEEYVPTDGGIRGVDKNNFPNGIRFDHVLSSKAVLHHGCTDGSLADLLVDVKPVNKAPAAPAEAKPVAESHEQPELPQIVDSVLCPPPKRKVKIPA